jgi:hypothetical protein
MGILPSRKTHNPSFLNKRLYFVTQRRHRHN